MTRLVLLRARDFRVFYAGYATSLLGSSMAIVAIAFAVLRTGGDASDLGLVLAARTVPQVIVVLAGGVAADRFGSRAVMLQADAVRCAGQAGLAISLFLGSPRIVVFAVFAAVGGTAEGIFGPAFSALTAEIAPAGELGNANAMLSLANSAARVAGPALAGLLITVTSPAVVIAVDAASYAASVLALAMLRTRRAKAESEAEAEAETETGAPGGRRLLRDLADGWREFRAHRWLTPSTLQFTVINMLVWGPFLLLGPVLSSRHPGGAAAWGVIMAGYGAGSVAGGLLALGRRPRRPLAASAAAALGYGLPCAAMACGAPLGLAVVSAILAGTGSAVSGAFALTVIQQQVPRDKLARVRSIQSLAAFCAGPAGLILAGPAAAAVGATTVLGFAAAASAVAALAVLAAPSVRRLTWTTPPGTGMTAHGELLHTSGTARVRE